MKFDISTGNSTYANNIGADGAINKYIARLECSKILPSKME